MRKVFVVITGLLTLSAVLQIYFAAVGVFSIEEEGLFDIHGTNGRIVLPILVLLTILSAALARAGARTIWLSVLTFGLLVLQTLIFIIVGTIFNIGPESPEIPRVATFILALHGLNGLAIIGLSGYLFNRARRLAKEPPASRERRPAAPVEVDTVPRA